MKGIKIMLGNLLKKLIGVILILIGVTFLAFLLAYFSPSDPASVLLNQSGISPTEEQLQEKRHEMGLDKPFLVQYGTWLENLLKGDMGTSYKSGKPVTESFIKAIPNTLALTIFALILTMVISIPLGLGCARYKDGVLDNVVRIVTYLFASLPSFFVALLALYFFAIQFHWFNVIAEDNFWGMVMPALVLSLSLCAWYIRQVRAIALEQMSSGYIVGLRARGVPEHVIFTKHILKNSMVPIVTLMGLSFGSLLGGTAIVETIFSWPGVGRLAVEAVNFRDYPVIQAYAVWMAAVFLFVNYFVEIIYRIVDPRIKRGRAA